MKRLLKRLLKILGIVLLAIIALMIIVPYFFKDNILTQSKKLLNEKLDAKVEFSDLKLSLFKRFPNLNIGLYDLTVSGKGQFESDTLVQFESLNVSADLLSALKKNIKVEGIYLVKPQIFAKVATDSSANWDIYQSEPDTSLVEEEPEDTTESTTSFRAALKEFKITDASIRFHDSTANLFASLKNLNYTLKGDFGADSSHLEMNLGIKPVMVKMGAIKYLNQASINFKAGIDANLEKQRYHLEENQFSINGLTLAFDGLVEMLENGRINTDLALRTNKASFKSLMSLVPAVYTKDFQELETSGNLSLNAKISGYYKDDIYPSMDLNLLVENAMFGYPDLPKKVENINISLQTYFDGVNNDNSVVKLDKFHFEIADSPFDAYLMLTQPISDPKIDAEMKGKLILENLADAIPMEDTKLTGTINSDFGVKGTLSMIEDEKYEQFDASGGIQIQDMQYSSPDLPAKVTIASCDFRFTPQYLDLKELQTKLGKSDFSLSGKIENYLAYVLKDGTIRGDFTARSDYLNANEFMTEETEEEETEEEDTTTTELSVVQVPDRIDFKLASHFKEIIYDEMEIKDARGTILVRDRTVYLDGFQMDLFEGNMMADGEYNTQDTLKPKVNFNLSVEDIQMENALKSFAVLGKVAPILKKAQGDISLDLKFLSNLQQNMMPDLSTMNGYGELRSDQLVLGGSEGFNKVMKKIKLADKEEQTFRNVNINFLIENGKVIVKPFDVKWNNMKMTVAGSQSLDKTMDYLLDINVPREKLGETADKAYDQFMNFASSKGVDLEKQETINVKAKVTGSFSDPKVAPAFGEGGESSVKEQAKEKVKEEVKKKVSEEAAKQAQEIISQAEKRAGKVKEEARQAAKKIRQEADDKADKIEQKAKGKNPLAKKAAQATAKKIREEADQKAEQLIKEADKKAEQIMKEAREKAEKIKEEG